MYPERTVQHYLLDSDGTTRDVTFTPCSRDSLLLFLRHLLVSFRPVSLTDNEGDDRMQQLMSGDFAELIRLPTGYLHGVWQSESGLLRRLQTFIDWPADAPQDYAVELSFFPDEVHTATFSVRAFHAQIEAWRLSLGAKDYFVRQENASWDIYDAAGLGVIYTHSKPPLWQ
jgi:hypothetical protein